MLIRHVKLIRGLFVQVISKTYNLDKNTATQSLLGRIWDELKERNSTTIKEEERDGERLFELVSYFKNKSTERWTLEIALRKSQGVRPSYLLAYWDLEFRIVDMC